MFGEGLAPGTPGPRSSRPAGGSCLLPSPAAGGTAAIHQAVFSVVSLNSVLPEPCVSPKLHIFWALTYGLGEGEFSLPAFVGQNQKGTSITAEVRKGLAIFHALCPSA